MATTTISPRNWATTLGLLLLKGSVQVNDRGHLLQVPLGKLHSFLSPRTGLLAGAAGVKASGTLTSTGVAPADGAVVSIGGKAYTYKTTLTAPAVEAEVLIGVSAAVALDNLKDAVNRTGTPGTQYNAAAAHPTIEATTNTDTTQLFVARAAGTAGNALATTETSSVLSFGGATLSGGSGVAAAALDVVEHLNLVTSPANNVHWLEVAAADTVPAGFTYKFAVTTASSSIAVKTGATTHGTISTLGTYLLRSSGSAWTLTKVADLT